MLFFNKLSLKTPKKLLENNALQLTALRFGIEFVDLYETKIRFFLLPAKLNDDIKCFKLKPNKTQQKKGDNFHFNKYMLNFSVKLVNVKF